MSFSGEDYTKEQMKLATKLLGKEPIYLWIVFDITEDGTPTMQLTANLSSKKGYADIRVVKNFIYEDGDWMEKEI